MVVRVAVVGTGFGLYGQLPAFNSIKEVEIVGLCGEKTERAVNYCRQIGLEGKIYTDYKKMIEKEKPDALAIAVPPKVQYEITKYALGCGIAVFAEKPLAASVEEAKALYLLAKEKNLPNMVDFIFPEIPEWIAAKKAIENGSIGKVTAVDIDWRFLSYDVKNQVSSWKTDPAQGGGALLFYFSHVFYYMEYFLGKIKSMECKLLTSEKSPNGGETGIEMKILFENGCSGTVIFDSAYEGVQHHSIIFKGEKGTIELQNNSADFVDNFEVVIVKGGGRQRIEPETRLVQNPSEDPRIKIVRSIARRFVEWCNNGIPSRPDFKDGMRVQELIEKAKNVRSE